MKKIKEIDKSFTESIHNCILSSDESMNILLQTPTRVTTNTTANEQLLYFTSSSLLNNDYVLVFISDRTGHPNIFSRNLVTNQEQQLTRNKDGYLKSYVYFDGNENKGLGKASISLDTENGRVYYLQGREIRCVDMSGYEKVLAELPKNQVSAFTHVSSDGTRLCVPTTDARALEDIQYINGKCNYDIDQRIREENLKSYLRVYDTATGEEIFTEVVPQAWVTHVQFSPVDHDLILYNHEWPSDCGVRRMWLWNGKTHLRLRYDNEERSRLDWTCHEMWERNGKEIIYHGVYHNKKPYVGKIYLDGMRIVEISFPPHYQKYGHFTVSNNGILVSDGYYEPSSKEDLLAELSINSPTAKFISIQKPDWKNKTFEWIPLCQHGSNWDSQDSHPHPIFNHRGDAIYFTSNKDGNRAVYRVLVPE